jgi:hypothetical protein
MVKRVLLHKDDKDNSNGEYYFSKRYELLIASSSSSPPLLFFDNLPEEIIILIIGLSQMIEKHVLRFVCKRLHSVVHSTCSSIYSKFPLQTWKMCARMASHRNYLEILKWFKIMNFLGSIVQGISKMRI